MLRNVSINASVMQIYKTPFKIIGITRYDGVKKTYFVGISLLAK